MVASNQCRVRESDIIEALDAAIRLAEGLHFGEDDFLWEAHRHCLRVVRRGFADEWGGIFDLP
jgi:hypothetical protein